MSRRFITTVGAAVALIAAGAPSAQAAQFDASRYATADLPYCYGATYGATEVAVCAAEESATGQFWVDPAARTDCRVYLPGVPVTVQLVVSCEDVGATYSGLGRIG